MNFSQDASSLPPLRLTLKAQRAKSIHCIKGNASNNNSLMIKEISQKIEQQRQDIKSRSKHLRNLSTNFESLLKNLSDEKNNMVIVKRKKKDLAIKLEKAKNRIRELEDEAKQRVMTQSEKEINIAYQKLKEEYAECKFKLLESSKINLNFNKTLEKKEEAIEKMQENFEELNKKHTDLERQYKILESKERFGRIKRGGKQIDDDFIMEKYSELEHENQDLKLKTQDLEVIKIGKMESDERCSMITEELIQLKHSAFLMNTLIHQQKQIISQFQINIEHLQEEVKAKESEIISLNLKIQEINTLNSNDTEKNSRTINQLQHEILESRHKNEKLSELAKLSEKEVENFKVYYQKYIRMKDRYKILEEKNNSLSSSLLNTTEKYEIEKQQWEILEREMVSKISSLQEIVHFSKYNEIRNVISYSETDKKDEQVADINKQLCDNLLICQQELNQQSYKLSALEKYTLELKQRLHQKSFDLEENSRELSIFQNDHSYLKQLHKETLEVIKNTLRCEKCKNILTNPLLVLPCRHVICQICSEASDKCSVCDRDASEIISDSFLSKVCQTVFQIFMNN